MQPEQTPQPWEVQPPYPGQEQWPAAQAGQLPPQGHPAPDYVSPPAGQLPPQGYPVSGPVPPGVSYSMPGQVPPGHVPPAAGQVPPGWGAAGPRQPWMVPFDPHHARTPHRRGPRKALIIGLVAAVGVLGAGAVTGVNAYAKHSICSSLADDSGLGGGSNSSTSDSDAPTAADIAEMRDGADQLRGYGHMLVFDGDLRSAVNGLADDVDQLVDLVGAASAGSTDTAAKTGSTDDAAGGALARLVTIAASVNSHARQAQRACDLPVKGIFDS